MPETRYSCKVNGGDSVQVAVEQVAEQILLTDDEGTHAVEIHPSRQSIRSATIDNRQVEFGVVKRDGVYQILIDGIDYEVQVVDARFEKLLALGGESSGGGGAAQVKAPIPGLVVRVLVESGEQVSRDQPLLILDAMKLENEILSPSDGTVASISVKPGQAVEKGEPLIEVS